jgi:transcriptional regulator with XRE-family HTH domain
VVADEEARVVTVRPGPTVQRRRLGIELRRLREQAGNTIDEVARALECSDSKVSRIETGQVSATPRDVRDMLDLYGVSGEQREALIQVARQARQKGWWQAYGDTLVVPLVGLETAAGEIRAYEPMAVHGLLQTPSYARAIIAALRPDLSRQQVERWVELRIARQALLTREDPPSFTLLLEECVLRRPVGGRQAMREQLQRIAAAAALPAVTLQVLPLTVGEHAAMSGAFTIYRFDDPTDPDVVYLEHTTSDLYLESPEQVERYASAFERLQAAALGPEGSAELVAAAAEAL